MGKTVIAVVCAFAMFLVGCGDQWLVEGDDGTSGVTSFGDGSDEPTLDGFSSTLIGLDITPGAMTLDLSATAKVMAIGNLETGGRRDITSRVVWSSSADAVATVENGLVTPHQVGSTTLTAAMEGMTASAVITVTSSSATVTSLSVSADNATLPNGESMQYHATATMSDGERRDVTAMATWAVSPSSIATITSAGVATGTHTGAGAVTAAWSGKAGAVPLVVTSAQFVRIEVDPAAFSVGVGFSKTATATAVYTDGSTLDVTALAQWTTAPTSVATVLPLGIVTGRAVGTATLTATIGNKSGTAAVAVTAATLVSLEITPAVISVSVGGDIQLSATGVFSDGTRVDMTNQVIWTSAALGTAMVSTTGKVTTNAIGVAAITATFDTRSASVLVAVTGAQLSQIQVPGALTLPVGRWVDLAPIGLFTDGLTALLGTNVTFSTSDASIASVSASGRITANGPGEVIITVTSGLISVQVHVTVTQALLQTILVTPVAAIVTRGATLQMAAMATYSDGSVVDVTAQGGWTTATPAIASVSNAAATKGVITGVATGITTVTVIVDGVSASAAVTVSPAILADLIVTPPSLVLPKGMDGALVAIGHYSDDSTLDLTTQVVWTSSDPAIATVSNALGLFGKVSAKAPGTATITATKGSVSKTVSVTVTQAILDHIELPAVPLTIPRGLTAPVIALGVYSDGSYVDITAQVNWSSSAPAIASVSNLVATIGLVTGNAVGTATLTASYSGKTQTVGVTVTSSVLQSIQLPATMNVPKGLTLPVVATGVYSDGSTVEITASVTWSSSAPSIASVSNVVGNIGLVTGNAVGDAVLTASFNGKSSTVAVHVTSAILSSISLGASTLTVPRGLTLPIVATGTYTDGSIADLTSSVTWASSNPAIATVSSLLLNAGLVTGVSQGTATVTATLNGKSATTTVTVTASILGSIQLPAQTINVPRGLSVPVTAMGLYSDGSLADITANVTWTSSAPAIASVSGLAASIGVVTGNAVGDATLTASMGGKTATVTVHVTAAVLSSIQLPSTLTVARGLTLPIVATGVYSDGSLADLTSSVVWTSSAPTIASVSGLLASAGLVTGVTQGTAIITATLNGQASTTTVTVTAPVLAGLQFLTSNVTVAKGLSAPVVAQAVFSDGTLTDVTTATTWTSAAPAIATVSNVLGTVGLVRGVSVGDTTVTASYSGKTATTVVHVTAAILSSITLPQTGLSIPKGLTLPIVATGVYSDGSLVDLTSSVTFSSSNTSVATVSSLLLSAGLVTGVGVGTATITATVNGKSATTTVTVTPSILGSIQLPSSVTVAKGLTVPVVATGLYSDGSVADITANVTWTTASPAVASVSGLAASIGLVTGNGVGTTMLTATLDGKTSTTSVTVSPAVLSSILAGDASVTVPRGLTLPVAATAVYSDGSIADITASVTWSSSAPSIATVSNLVGSVGLVTGIAAGDATLTASYNGKTTTVAVHVTAAILSSISFGAPTMTVPRGLTLPIIATGTYSDGTTADLTASVVWSSSAPSVATVSSLLASAGLVTGVAQGTAIVTATIGSKSTSTTVTVTSAVLSAIQLPTQTINLPRGLTVPVVATGVYTDGSLADITSSVTWSSSAPAIASVSGLAASIGVVTGNAVGDATITATLGGKTSTVPVHVTAAILSGIQFPAASMNVPKGLTLPVIATGVYSDGSFADITSNVTWTSSAPGIASVSSLAGSAGLVTGVAAGDATITATFGSSSQSITVHVTAAVLSSITLPAGTLMVPKGLFAPVIATGVYSDGSLATITSSVTWTSSAPTIATVSNVIGAAGIVNGVQTGFATITATIGATSQSMAVQVTPAILGSISVNAPSILGILQVGAVTATGTYSDGTTADLTSQVTFGSSNVAAATVSATGALLGLGLGTTTISATLGGITGSSIIGIGAAACHLVINEIKAGTLLKAKDDFIEIYNPCSFAVDLSQVALVYRDAIDTVDKSLVTLSGSIGANSYRIYVGAQFSSGGTVDGTFAQDLGGLLGGGVGLRIISTGTLIDSVAWGVSINGLNEGALLGAITLGGSLARTPNGRDTDANLADFALLTTVTPRAAN